MTFFWIGFLAGTLCTAYFYPTIHGALKARGWV